MNRADVVDLVVGLVDLDLDADLVDVDLAVSLCDGPRSVSFSFGLVALAVKTEFVCIVFTPGLGPKLVELNFCVVFYELVWGQPRSVLPAAW